MYAGQSSEVVSNSDRTDFEELISRLPREWDIFFKSPTYKYQDFWFLPGTLEGILSAQQGFVAQPEDIILCSAPKTGTTWLKALSFTTANRAKFDVGSATHPLLADSPHECEPCIEEKLEKILTSSQRFRVVSTHMPCRLLPESIWSSGCKIVYVWRDPKDVFASMLHFGSSVSWGTELDNNAVPIDEAFDRFYQGISTHGPYWDHVVRFLRASEEQPEKFMCLTYEELRENSSECVRRLAEFFGQPFSAEEEERGVAKKIVDLCSFDNLQNLKTTKEGETRLKTGSWVIRNKLFYRRGKVGDWRNHLSPTKAALLDNTFANKFAEAGLEYPT